MSASAFSSASLLSSKGVKWIGLGWSAFIAENLILSDNREEIIRRFGSQNYHTVYNTLSSCATASILYGFIRYRKTGPMLPVPGVHVKLCGYLLQTAGLVGVSQLFPKLQSPYEPDLPATTSSSSSSSSSPSSPSSAVASAKSANFPAPPMTKPSPKLRCPLDFKAADVPKEGIYGMDRVTRHSTFWSFGIWSLGHACTATFLPEVVFFGFPVVFALIGGWHQDVRYMRGSGGSLTKEKYEVTSNVPLVALLKGKQKWSDLEKEMKWSNAAVASFLSSTILIFRKIR